MIATAKVTLVVRVGLVVRVLIVADIGLDDRVEGACNAPVGADNRGEIQCLSSREHARVAPRHACPPKVATWLVDSGVTLTVRNHSGVARAITAIQADIANRLLSERGILLFGVVG